MGKAIFLSNPELNVDDVTVAHSSAIGRRAGFPVRSPLNSGRLKMSAIGDAGDGLDRIVEIKGKRRFPRYQPRTAVGAPLFTDPSGFDSLGNLAVLDTTGCALVAVYDRLHFVVLSGDVLTVYVWDGSTWSARSSLTIDHDGAGGIAACAKDYNIYIAVGDNVESAIVFYYFNAVSFALGEIGEGTIETESPGGIALASDGTIFVLLHDVDLGGGLRDVRVMMGGDVTRLRPKAHTFLDMFDTTWAADGNIRRPALCWSYRYKFVAALRAGTTTPGLLKVVHSYDGDDWEPFTNILGVEAQPTPVAPSSNGRSLAIVPEGRRLYIFRTTGTFNGDPTDLKMIYFEGRQAWAAEVDADGGVDVDDQPRIAACNWRGTVYFAFPSSATQWNVRKCNLLTESDTSHSRAMDMGRRNYVAGPEDDSRVALFFTPRGAARAGDLYTLPAAYDHHGKRTITNILGETWRAEDDAEQWVRLDAGLGRAWALDTLAVFGTNLPSLTVELDDDPDFVTPPTSEALTATVATASVVVGQPGRLVCAAGSFAGRRFASGAFWVRTVTGLAGIFRVTDNTDDTLAVDGDMTLAGGDVTIYGDRMGLMLDDAPTPRRYLRLVTPVVQLPDDYYEVARLLFGMRYVATRDYAVGWKRRQRAVGTIQELNTGAQIPTRLNYNRQGAWRLRFPAAEGPQSAEMEGYFARLSEMQEQVLFFPEGDDEPNTVHLVWIDGPIEEEHRIDVHHDVEFDLLEVV